MSDSRPSVTIRMPVELMERIKAAAAASGRSMNAEIVQMLDIQVNTALGAVIDPWPHVPQDISEVRRLTENCRQAAESTAKTRDEFSKWSKGEFTQEESSALVPVLAQAQISVLNEQIRRYEEHMAIYEAKLRWLTALGARYRSEGKA